MTQSDHAQLAQLLKYATVFVLGAATLYFSQHARQLLDRKNATSPTPPQVQIVDFDTCAAQPGSKMLETYPAQCITADGVKYMQQTFVEEPSTPPPTHTDSQLPDNDSEIDNQKYLCPKTNWVDCMPGPNQNTKFECSEDFLQWASANCPDFEGAAY